MENSVLPRPSCRSGRQRRLTPHEARRRRLERYRLRRKRMIHIGLQVDRWHQLKSELDLENDAALAEFLLDYYRSHHTHMKLDSNPNTRGMAAGFRNKINSKSSTSSAGSQSEQAFQSSGKIPQRSIPHLLSAAGDTGENSDNDEGSLKFMEDSADETECIFPDNFEYSSLKDYTIEEQILNFVDDDIISGEQESVPILISSTKHKPIHKMRTGIVFDSCLMSLARKAFSTCECPDCEGRVHLQLHLVATAMKVTSRCSDGHESTWWSQPLVQSVPAGNVQLASSIVLSGNNYGKVALMMKFLNMLPIGHQSFLKIQTTRIQPSVVTYWKKMQAEHLQELGGPVVVLVDQYRNSRNPSMKYLTYAMMDNCTHKILDIQVVNVQSNARKLQNVESSGFLRAFQYLIQNELTVSEIVTGADPQILSLMKFKYPNVLHQIDLWHGVRAVQERLKKAAASADSRELQPWIKDIVRHFISCCLRCEGDANSLMSRWRSVLHHAVNVHEWLLGDGCTSAACEHGPLTEEEVADRRWVTVGSPAHCALREVVYDKWLTSHLSYFVHARVTDELEIFNKHIKIYATKNFTYDYEDYYVRTLLAAIDHNSHIDRAFQRSASGEISYCKMYSKQNRNWRVLPALVKKQYQYFEQLCLDILKEKPSKEASQRQSKTTQGRSKKALPATKPRTPVTSLWKSNLPNNSVGGSVLLDEIRSSRGTEIEIAREACEQLLEHHHHCRKLSAATSQITCQQKEDTAAVQSKKAPISLSPR